jgi:hypothetical protein
VRPFGGLLLALLLLSGCETVNDTLVRQWFKDSGLSRRLNYRIREGLERREAAPPADVPRRPAPDFLDQG